MYMQRRFLSEIASIRKLSLSGASDWTLNYSMPKLIATINRLTDEVKKESVKMNCFNLDCFDPLSPEKNDWT